MSAIVFAALVVHAQWGCERSEAAAAIAEPPAPIAEPPAPIAEPPAPAVRVEPPPPAPAPPPREEPKAKKSGLYDMKPPPAEGRYLGSSKSDPDMFRRDFLAEPPAEGNDK